jgi:hypothetical protein
MDKVPEFVRISELMQLASRGSAANSLPMRSRHVGDLIEETFSSIETMTLDEREALLELLTDWIAKRRRGAIGQHILAGLRDYCIAECVFQNPFWERPPQRAFPAKAI